MSFMAYGRSRLAGAVSLGRLLEGLLYEVTPTDPLTLGAVAFMLLTVALAAAAAPAARATRIDPLQVLRDS